MTSFELERAGYQGFESDYMFHPTRDWRFSFAWPEQKVALDLVERHNRVNSEKVTEAQLEGWLVVMVPAGSWSLARALNYLQRAFALRKEQGNAVHQETESVVRGRSSAGA